MKCHLQTVGHRKRCDETVFYEVSHDTHYLLAIVARCDETTFHKLWNITHQLLVIIQDLMSLLPFTKCAMSHPLLVAGRDLIRFSFIKCAMSPTPCQSQEKMWWDVCHKIFNIAHILLGVIGKKYTEKLLQCYSHTGGHSWEFDKEIFWITKPAWHAANLLHLWQMMWFQCFSQNLQ